jgi:hypothetical protein
MSLTKTDLKDIKTTVNDVVHDVVHDVVTREVNSAKAELMVELAKKADKADVDRMESRVVAAIGLLERDHDGRLTDLETRVGRLEQASR